MKPSAHAKIVGGFEVGTNSSLLSLEEQNRMASHTVALIDVSSTLSFKTCTATLIAPDLALTAAHCVDQIPKENLFLVTSPFSSAVLSRHAIQKIIKPDEYKSFDLPTAQKPNFDLAIVRFKGPMPPLYQPVRWTDFLYEQKNVWTFVAGYGTSSAAGIDSGSLRIGKVTHPEISGSSSFFIGQQNLGSGVCHGDSGGPVFVRMGNGFVLIGVTSAVVPRDPLQPSILIGEACLGTSYFNSTYFYRDWIGSTIKQLGH